MRIFQLAKELNVESQEILDALEDMDIQVKSNLASVSDEVVSELRELFKPKPKPSQSAPKKDTVRRVLEEREARERAAEEAKRREEERKEAARRAALDRAASRRRELQEEKARSEAERAASERERQEALRRAAAEASERERVAEAPAEEPEAEPAASAPEAPSPGEAAPSVQEPAQERAPAARAPGEPAEAGRPAAKEDQVAAAKAIQAAKDDRPGGLGKAVIAPPPATASERAALLGKSIAELRQRGATAPGRTRPAAPTTPRPSGPPRPAGGRPGASGRGAPVAGASGEGPRRKGKGRKGGRRGAQQQSRSQAPRPEAVDLPVGEVAISDGITVKDLAERMNRKAKDIITKLFLERRVMLTINHSLDEDTAAWVVESFGGTPKPVAIEEEAAASGVEAGETSEEREEVGTEPRAPVVTMMGHVDHGKTSLLDAIKQTRVAEREAGGITQHIGAYKISKEHEGQLKEIVFLDTPGHEAFTLMRARGATVTDIIVLVVAADDGVMPQTREAISHARNAGVPMIVAVNKVDKAGAQPDRVLQQLTNENVLVEAFGGDTVTVNVSAKTGEGLDDLLEMILLQSEILELGASSDRPASGTVLEAKLDKTRGAIATVLVENGSLRVGDTLVAGAVFGRVRALVDERDRRLQEVGPSTPVVIMGLEEVPLAGDPMQVFPDEQKARQIALYRQGKQREERLERRAKVPSLETIQQQIREGEVSEVPVVLKADVQGSVEVLRSALEDLSTGEVGVSVVHAGTGAITETDVMLAAASRAIVVGFNVRPQRGVAEVAEREGVDIRMHTVIYKVTDEIKQAMLAQLSPVEKEVYLGRAEVLEIFKVPKIGSIAGSKVTEGVIRRDAQVRLLRDNVVIYEGKISSLKRFKDDAREVRSGFECGIGLERFNDVKPGDEIEAFVIEKQQRESLEPEQQAREG